MPRGVRKNKPQYFIFNKNCENFYGPFEDLETAKDEGGESLDEYNSNDEDVLIMQLVGTLSKPPAPVMAWKPAAA